MFGWTSYARTDRDPEPSGAAIDPGLAAELAANLNAVLAMAARAVPSRRSATAQRIESHLGIPLAEATMVGASWPLWQHASVQRAVEAYLGTGTEWFGLAVSHAEHQELADLLLQESSYGRDTLAQPQWVEVAAGPDTMIEAVKLGLAAATTPAGAPAVLCLRTADGHHGSEVRVELVLADAADGARPCCSGCGDWSTSWTCCVARSCPSGSASTTATTWSASCRGRTSGRPTWCCRPMCWPG